MTTVEQPVTAHPAETSATSDVGFYWLVKFWIWLCALAGLAGWGLSQLEELNGTGYLVFFGLVAVFFFKFGRPADWRWLNGRKFLRRFRQPLPGAFAVLALLVFGGSVFYPPTNYTGLNYHLARVLQWLAQGQWFWIHTQNVRMNFSGCAFEWLTTPLVLFTKSDRALFLVNFVPFLLLPGLIFSVFTRLGIHARVARQWMWLLPTGYIFLLQSGSIDNDAFGAALALATIDFGCRAWVSRRIQDLWVSMLAVGLLTGTKPTNLPLVLPWAVLVLPLLARMPWRDWLISIPVAALAGIASFLPMAGLNYANSGDWLGRSTLSINLEVHQPLVGLVGNGFQLVAANFVPTVFPLVGWWNQEAPRLIPSSMMTELNRSFDPSFYVLGEIPTEDWTGLGFGLSVLLVASILGAIWFRGNSGWRTARQAVPLWLCRAVMVAAWISLLAFSMKSGMATAARLIAPYYLLLVLLPLAMRGQVLVVRRVWWRALAGAAVGLAFLALILSPDRPLWPAQTVLAKLLAMYPHQNSVARALKVYTLYSHRNDVLAGVREFLPPDLRVVGFVGTTDDCDVSLWRPFGSRRVEHCLLSDSAEYIKSRVQYVVVGGCHLKNNHHTIDEWLQFYNAELLATTNIEEKIEEGPQPWYVTRIKE